MEPKKEGKMVIRIAAAILIVFTVLYVLLGIIAAMAKVDGVGVAIGSGGTMVMILAYGSALLALIAAIIGFRTAKEAMSPKACGVLGYIIAALGIITDIYLQVSQGKFEFFNMILIVCGVFYVIGAKKMAE